MSEKSAGVKGKPPERQEDVSDENNGQRKEKINNTQIESGTQDKYYQYDKGGKYTDKRVDSRFMAKSNINKTSNNANTIRPRREDGRRSPRVSSGRGREVKSSVLFKSDYRRSSAVEGSRYFNEDLKLFRYLKRMYKDVDREKRLVNLKQLKEYIKSPDGAKEARKCADEMLNALQDVLYERIPKEVKQEAAHCTGIVGGILGSEAQSYFHWLFGHTSTENVVSDEIKCFFLEALVQTLKYDEKRQSVANIIPMAMIHLQSLLETADTPEFLTSVVEAILLISKQYPHVFTSHFRDTVDILVGWHIDSAQKDSLTSFTSQVLVELQPFWVSDIAFSVTLLGQFMEDMEAYAGDIDFNQDDKDAMEDCAGKLMALMKVFTTVVRSMGSSFGTVDHHLMPKDYILTLLMRILSAVEQVVKSFPSEKILTTANACVQSLVQQLGAEAQAKAGFLLQYILMQTEADKFLSYPYILSVLLLVQKTVESMDIKHLPVTFFTKLMAPSSLLRQARFANSTEVVQTTVNLLHSIMALKNVPLLEEVYRHIVGDLQVAYNTLLSCSGESKTLTLTEVNPMEGIEYTPQEAEAVFVFNLAVLGEIGTTKSNLMAMWALSPSLFDLFSVHFDPLEPSVSEMFPAVQYAVLKALYSHCARHGNFVSSSRLLTSSSYKEGSVLANVSHTNSANFSRILSLVTSVISSPSTSYEGRLLCLKWASDICASLQSNIALFGSEAFVSLLQVLVHWGHQEDMCITLSICHCLESVFLLSNNLSDVIVHGVLKLSMFKQTDNREKVREAYFSLLRLVPVDKAVRLNGLLHLCDDSNQTVSLLEGAEGVTSAWLAKRAHIASLPSNKFHNLNFRQVMAFILNNVKPVQSGSWHWLEVMFCDCQQQSTTKEHRNGLDSFLLTDFVKGNDGMLWFWATWEAAQFCVLNRLRTPLGKPQDTFTSIEGVLKTFAMSLVTSPEDAMVSRKGSSEGPEDLGCHLRVSLLLQFMEHLEKLLYNAYEGCAVAMPMSPKAVRTFFRTNKNTCLEWLSRIRTNIIRISLHCGCPATAVRHAYEQLQELRDGGHTQGPEFDQTILYLVQALTDLKQPDALMGVFTWCKEMLGKKLLWIKAAVEKASGRYEDAAKEFRLALNSLLTSEEDTRTDPETKSTDNMAAMKITGILSKHNPLQQTTQLNDQNLLIQKIHFTVNETMDSYMCLNDWDSMLEWQEELMEQRQQGSYSNLQSGLVPSVDINYVKALSSFDLGDHTKVRESFELVPGFSFSDLCKGLEIHNRIWGAKQKVESLHKTFIQTATMAMEDQEEEKTAVLDCLGLSEKMAQNLLRIQATEWPLLMSQQVLAELSTLVALKRHIQGSDSKKVKLPLSRDIKLDIEEHDLSHFLHLIRFLEVEQELTGSQDDPSHQLFELQIATASLSRKLGNFQKAETLLMGQIGSLGKETTDNGFIASEELLPSLMTLRSSHKVTSNLDILRLEREGAKLLHATGSTKEAIDLLSSSIVSFIAADQPKGQEEKTQARCRELCSRSLLALVKWTQLDMKSLNSVTSKLFSGDSEKEALSSSLLAQNLQTLLEAEETGAKKKQGLVLDELDIDCALRIGDHPILSETDSMIGRMLHLGTMQAPSLSKAWFALGNWCYKWGRKAVDSASHGSVELLADEKAEVLSLLPKGTSSEETSKVIGVLSQIHSLASNEEDITENDEDNCDEGTETTRKQLLSCCLSLQIASEDCIDKLINVWRGIVYRVYHYYQLSAKGYFTYLRLNGTVQESEVNGDKNVIATLRLLRLLVKHAWELRNVLESGLAHTPTGPWKGIIPQLFSRLSHPELYVRQSISELLCRVAQDAPHLIVYPAVVGCSSAKTENKDTPRSGILNECLSPESEADGDSQHSQEAEEEDPSNTMLQNCLTAIVETLSANNPRMISEVKQLVLELRRITLLWDELWLGSLTQQHPEVSRKLQQLESEVKKVTSNSSLGKEEKMAIIREKHRTIMKPTVYAMERIQEITSQPAETPHEQAFQDMYGKLIDTAIEKLRNPTNPSNPSSSWQLFKQLHASLQKTAQKRSSLFLRMEKISPKIASLRNTVIAMPGLGASGKAVTIGSVSNTVQILPTKTKPKKLILLGSDGKKYPYLFKGLEDLHLDERIMQFLSIANNMLVSARSGDQHMYRARHYSVTPLGLRSGLIQWVEGATPLFGMYKKWQYREALAQLAKAQTGSVSTAPTSTQQPTPTIQRPSEIFYNKLTPALKDKGVTNFENRKEWPLTVLKTVLQELIDETPGDLLARELWCSSAGASEWWHVSQTYARSTAVMSMIGYIIGLGDRHLDNVLIDTATGEVVHIDYNVSFEKGKGLRVPEKVPFRMTQNIEKALGVTGIEGTFRIASEHVMKVMRKSRETLLTLLEAFVYDPLVDWTTGNEGGYTGAFYGGGALGGANDGRQTKQELEREITLSMFSIRMAEMKAQWQKNRDEMVAALPQLQQQVEGWMSIAQAYYSCHSNHQNMKDLQVMLREAIKDTTGSQLFSLKKRYEEYMQVKTSQDSVNLEITDKIEELTHWHSLHKYVIETINSQTFQLMCQDINSAPSVGAPSFASASDFLTGAGQGQVISQCEQLETEMTGCLQHIRANLHHAIEVLSAYANVVAQFGTGFADQNRTYHYLCWLQEVMNDFTTKRCAEVNIHFENLYGSSSIPKGKTQMVLITESKLQTSIKDWVAKRRRLVERRNQELVETQQLEKFIQDYDLAIKHFVQENGVSGCNSLMAWIISFLCTLNKRYNQMENAAAGAGDRLMDLTSRDGDWFLDELCSMSSNVVHFIDTLKVNTAVIQFEHFQSLYQALMSTHNIYIAMQDLHVNFRTIILPESLKAIQAQEPSVMLALDRMETMFAQAQLPMDKIVDNLETLHRNAIMGVENDSLEMMTQVKRIQIQYDDLLEGDAVDSKDLSPGQMLLIVFNNLFIHLEQEFDDLMNAMDSLKVPTVWRKVDAVREGKSMQLSSFVGSTRNYLSSLFFVKRLQAMQEFFHMCKQTAVNLQGMDGGNFYDDEILTKPIKRFIAEYVRNLVIGFPSQVLGYMLCVLIGSLGVDVTAEIELKDIGAESKVPLEDLRKKAVDICLRNGHFQHGQFTQASALTNSLDAAWRRHDLAKRLDINIDMIKGSLLRAQHQLTRLQWLHEDAFLQTGRQISQMEVPNRTAVMSEMKKIRQALIGQESGFVSCRTRYTQLEASIVQRLKWAAGANPSLTLTLQQFEDASALRKRIYEDTIKHSTEVVKLCQGILHLEALRTRTHEASVSDANFRALINRCEESTHLSESTNSSVTELEILLMNTKPPEKGATTDEGWVESCVQDISEQIVSTQQEVETLKRELEIASDGIKTEAGSVRNVLSVHHKLMTEFRTILKSMAKQEEQDLGDIAPAGSVRDYLNTYKNFSENFSTMLKIVMTEDVSKEGMAQASSLIDALNTQVSLIYDDLINLAPPLLTLEENAAAAAADFSIAAGRKGEMREVAPRKGGLGMNCSPHNSPHTPLSRISSTSVIKKQDKVTRDPRTGKAMQERNSYAVGVWRRVKMKLDGKDPDPNKRFTVAEQVDYVINEATHLDNLAVLYEGWTPWV